MPRLERVLLQPCSSRAVCVLVDDVDLATEPLCEFFPRTLALASPVNLPMRIAVSLSGAHAFSFNVWDAVAIDQLDCSSDNVARNHSRRV